MSIYFHHNSLFMPLMSCAYEARRPYLVVGLHHMDMVSQD